MPIPTPFAFVYLGNDDGSDFRDSGFAISEQIFTGTNKPKQGSFFPYQKNFTSYPAELVRRLIRPPSTQTLGLSFGGFEQTLTMPDEFVQEYDPDFEAVPNPNGNTLDLSNEYPPFLFRESDIPPVFALPRFSTDDPYDLKDVFDVIPQTGDKQIVSELFVGTFPIFGKYCSIDITVENGDSKVLNVKTDEYEYYPFAQSTTVYTATGSFRVDYVDGAPLDELCCPTKNAVISGKAKIWSVSVTGSRYEPDNTGYNGIEIEVGSDYAEEETLDWSFTFDPDNPTPDSIVIPTKPNKITFINDWWIESITPPAP